jgi:hypothetical protein
MAIGANFPIKRYFHPAFVTMYFYVEKRHRHLFLVLKWFVFRDSLANLQDTASTALFLDFDLDRDSLRHFLDV